MILITTTVLYKHKRPLDSYACPDKKVYKQKYSKLVQYSGKKQSVPVQLFKTATKNALLYSHTTNR